MGGKSPSDSGAEFFFKEIRPTALTRNFRRIYFRLAAETNQLRTTRSSVKNKNLIQDVVVGLQKKSTTVRLPQHKTCDRRKSEFDL